MKRARTEQIQALVLNYLKERNYTDSEASFKLEFKFEETLREMSSRLSEDADVSTTNAVGISVFTIDEYFTAFEEFITFCHLAKEEHPKLNDMIYPIFCHIYLDLVMSSRKGDATNFFGHFEDRVIQPSCSKYPLVQKLARVIHPGDLANCNQMNEFRRKKFFLNVPQSTNSLLMRFLHATSCLVLLKIINLHFCISVIEDQNILDLFSTGPKKSATKSVPTVDNVAKRKKIKSSTPVEAQVKSAPVTLTAPSLSSPAPFSNQSDAALTGNQEVDIKTLKDTIQKVYDLKPSVDNICLHRIQDTSVTGLTHASFSNDFQWISSGMEDSTVRLWDMSHSSQGGKTHDKCVDSSSDVSKVYLACDSRSLSQNSSSLKDTLRAHSSTVTCSCFSHDDKYLISGSEDSTVRLWDLASRRNKVIYRGHVYPVWCISMSNYSFYFATGSLDKTAKLWTFERTHPIRTFAGHHGDVESIAFHGNSTYVATADKTVRLWDINSGKTVRILMGHWAPVLCIAFSPDGKFLASSGEDGRIRLWDIASGTLIKEIRGHEGSVYTLDFSPDGSMLASGGADSCLRVWNTRTSQTPQTRGNTDVNDPELNPDYVGRWHCGSGVVHTVKFEAVNMLHCIASDR